MAQSAERFHSYRDELETLLGTMREKLATLDGRGSDRKPNGEARKATISRMQMEVEEADEIFAQLDLEFVTMPPSVKQSVQKKKEDLSKDIENFRKAFKEAKAKAESDRAKLGLDVSSRASSPIEDYDAVDSQRQRLLAGTDKLNRGRQDLDRIHSVALETEDVGRSTLHALTSQRQQIENTRDTLYSADSSIDRASNTLKKMIRRMNRQRILTVVIIIVLVFLIGIVLWSKFS